MGKTAVASDVIQFAHRSSSQIIDEIHGRTLDLCGLAAVVDKLADSQPAGSWADVFCHVRNSLNDLSANLLNEVDALQDAEDGR